MFEGLNRGTPHFSAPNFVKFYHFLKFAYPETLMGLA